MKRCPALRSGKPGILLTVLAVCLSAAACGKQDTPAYRDTSLAAEERISTTVA